jgi:ribosomal-protein-alanine N-acetyltransferase
MNPKYSFSKMTEPDAREVLAWRYEAPYDFYDAKDEELETDVQVLLSPMNNYMSVRDVDGALVGFYCFGSDAQVPGGEYEDEALDIGCSARPDLLGSGLGASFIAMAIDLLWLFFPGQKTVRTTVAAFNDRAMHVCESAGFVKTQDFTHENGVEFTVWVKEV